MSGDNNRETGSTNFDLLRPITDRVNDSFLGPLTLYFFIWNYEVILVAFSDLSVDVKILKIQSYFSSTPVPLLDGRWIVTSWAYSIITPILLTLFFTIIWPIWSTRLLEFIRKIKLERDDILKNVDPNGSQLRIRLVEQGEEILMLKDKSSKMNADVLSLVKDLVDKTNEKRTLTPVDQQFLVHISYICERLHFRDPEVLFKKIITLANKINDQDVRERVEKVRDDYYRKV